MATHFQAGTAVITGAASGIGRATAVVFARDGCVRLVLGDLSVPGLEETRNIIHKQYPEAQIEISELDVTKEDSVERFYALAVKTFDRIDYAANIAGYSHTAMPSTDITEVEFDKTFNVNLKGVFLCQRAQLRQMTKQDPLPGQENRGSIVNVSSLCSTIAMPGLMAYSGTKGGVLGLVKTDALDYGPCKIRVNCVGPGNTVTPMLSSAMSDAHIKTYSANTPLQRLGQPEDIGNAVAWLSSPMAAYITGILLPVDGGLQLKTGPV